MATATITSKGQITIPKEIRDQLRLKTGQRLEFQINDQKQVLLIPRTRDITELRGILFRPGRRPVSIEEMNKAIAEGYAGIRRKPKSR